MLQHGQATEEESQMRSVILTFATTHRAIAAEEALLTGRVSFEIVPLPSWIRSGCGLALRLPAEAVAEALEVLAGAEVTHEGLHPERENDAGPA
jgi:Protein of unknown function (DUF3343)